MSSGHYYAYVRGSSGMWTRMDDECVSKVGGGMLETGWPGNEGRSRDGALVRSRCRSRDASFFGNPGLHVLRGKADEELPWVQGLERIVHRAAPALEKRKQDAASSA